MNLYKTKFSKIFLGTVLSLFFLVLIVAGYLFFTQKKVASNTLNTVLAKVGANKITQGDLNEAIYTRTFGGTPENPTENLTKEEVDLALNDLIEEKIVRKRAAEIGLSATREEIASFLSKQLETAKGLENGLTIYDSYKDFQKNLAWRAGEYAVLKKKIKESQLAWIEGKYLLARFDKYNKDLPESVQIKVVSEKERAGLKEKQRVAAQSLAERLAAEINGGASYEKARTALATNLEVGYEGVYPQTPTMAGTIGRSDYYEGRFVEINQFDQFNLEAFNVENGKAQVLPLLKNNQGGSLDFYVIYVATDKKDGFRWGYDEWLEAQKKKLVQVSKLSSALKVVTKKVKAFAGDVCGTTNFGHAHCFDLEMYYVSRVGNTVMVSNYPFQLSTPGSSSGIYINGNSQGSLDMNTTANGHVYFSWPNGTPGDYHEDYVNCNVARQFKIALSGSGDNVNVPSSIPSAGWWDYQTSAAATAAATTNGTYVLSKGGEGAANNHNSAYMEICLNNDPGCNCSRVSCGVEQWGNGKSTWFNFVWKPHWNDAPEVGQTIPSGEQTLPAGVTSSKFDYWGWASDANQDTLKYEIEVSKQNEGGWDLVGSLSATPIGSGQTATSLWKSVAQPTGLELGEGSYKWTLSAVDGHGVSATARTTFFSVKKKVVDQDKPGCEFRPSLVTVSPGAKTSLSWFKLTPITTSVEAVGDWTLKTAPDGTQENLGKGHYVLKAKDAAGNTSECFADIQEDAGPPEQPPPPPAPPYCTVSVPGGYEVPTAISYNLYSESGGNSGWYIYYEGENASTVPVGSFPTYTAKYTRPGTIHASARATDCSSNWNCRTNVVVSCPDVTLRGPGAGTVIETSP